MGTFEITIQRRLDEGWPVVADYSAGDGDLPVHVVGTLELDQAELLPLALDAPKYGAVLGRALFREELRDAFSAARAAAAEGADDASVLHVLLTIEDTELRTLRWERLCAPFNRRWPFLTLDQHTPFSLYLPSLSDLRFPPFGRRDLRALVVVASPDGLKDFELDPFDTKATIESVSAALGPIPSTVLARGDGYAGPPSLDEIAAQITAQRYTLLHIVCHGRVAKKDPDAGDTVLYLESGSGTVGAVSGSALIERLEGLGGVHGLPHLVFLATCESASAEAEGALGGLGQRLVRDLGVPAVVAMTEKVTIDTAQALASAFYTRLRDHGWVDRALVEGSAALAGRSDATVPALYSRLGGRPLFSDVLGDRPLTAPEISDGLNRLEKLLPDRAPVLVDRFQGDAKVLRDASGTAVAALSPEAQEARTRALTGVRWLSMEATELDFTALAVGQDPPAYDGRQPFRGLAPFREEDRQFFFGREALVERLGERIAQHPFLAVLGPSGSGKSSVVLAGLLPALDGKSVVFTPGTDPGAQLDAALASAPASSVVVVDQFEELFTLSRDEDKREAFIGKLLGITGEHPVVITMRADFWGECAPYPELRNAMQAHQELIAPMDAAELRSAMERQAAAVGLRFDADLAQTVLDEVQGEPGAMPLLQHALLELWKRRHGRWLRHDEYRAIGGVRQAIAHSADDLYQALEPKDQERVHDIFMRLTRLDDQALGSEAGRETRRRVGEDELVPAGSDPAETKALVARLATASLVVTSVDAVSNRVEVEVAHEALIRYWPRLRGWLDAGRAELRLRAGITQAALDWNAGGRSDDLIVHRTGRLDDAVKLAARPGALNANERAYVEAAVAAQESERQRELEQAKALAEEQRQRRLTAERATRRLGILLVAAAALAVVAIAAALFAFRQQEVAQSRTMAAQALELRGSRPDLAMWLAGQAYDRNTSDSDVQSSLLATTQCCSEALIALLSGHTDSVWSVAFSRDGKMLASAGDDDVIRLWDIATLQEVGKPIEDPDNASNIYAIAFSPTADILAAGNAAGRITLWDSNTGGLIASLPRQSTIFALKFSGDGRHLVSGDMNGSLQLWDVSDPAHVPDPRSLPGIQPTIWIYDVAVNQDGTLVAATSKEDSSLRVWDLGVDPQVMAHTVERGQYMISLAFAGTPDNPLIVAGNAGGRVKLWALRPWLDAAPVVSAVAGSTGVDPTRLDATFVTRRSGWMALPGSWRDLVWGLAVLPGDGLSLVTSRQSGEIAENRIDLDDGIAAARLRSVAPPLRGHAGIYRIAVSPDGSLIAAAGEENLVSLWRAGPVPGVKMRPDAVKSLTLTADGDTVVLDKSGNIGNLTSGGTAERTPLDVETILASPLPSAQPPLGGPPPSPLPSPNFDSAISPDGTTIVTGNHLGVLMLWDALDGKLLDDRWVSQRRIRGLAFNPMVGTQFATVDFSARANLWDITNGKVEGPVATFIAENGLPFMSLAFDAAGDRLIVGGCNNPIGGSYGPDCSQGEAYILDVNNNLRPLDEFPTKSGYPSAVAIDPANHDRYAVGHVDGSVALYDQGAGGSADPKLVRFANDDITALSFSPDGTLLAVGTGGNVYLLHTDSMKFAGDHFLEAIGDIASIAFTDDGSTLVFGAADGSVVRRDLRPADWRERVCELAHPVLTDAQRYPFLGNVTSRSCPEQGLPLEPSLDPSP